MNKDVQMLMEAYELILEKKKEIKPKCSKTIQKKALKDGDCQADKKTGKKCPMEWLGTCQNEKR